MAVFTGHISQMYMNLQQVQYIETHPSKILEQMAQEKLNNVRYMFIHLVLAGVENLAHTF